jgi:hypothetical protein
MSESEQYQLIKPFRKLGYPPDLRQQKYRRRSGETEAPESGYPT